ncbi:MAG TPA: amidase family protein, partial [Vicinamibacterales bacterium]|nr:amidase family protein [Vicinamibacterales bacterium]
MTHLSRRAFTATMIGAAAAATRGAGSILSAQTGRSTASTAPTPGTADALAALTLSEVSARIKAGTVTSTELVNACLARIDVYNPKVNAFITVLREHALAQARVLDAEQRAGRLRGPLHGIPIALKDNIDTAGVRTTAASAVFDER